MSLVCRYLVLQHLIEDLDDLAQAGGALAWVPVGDSRHRVVRLRSSGPDAQLQPATRYMIHGESLLGQNRRVVQGDIGNYRPQAYPPRVRGKGRQKRPSRKGSLGKKGLTTWSATQALSKPSSSRYCQRSTSVVQEAF
jgi:hypothetical protein